MLKMPSQIETIVNAYKTLSKVPFVVGGRLNNAGTKVTTKQSVRNIDKGKNTKYVYNYDLDNNLNVTSRSEFGSDVSNVLLSTVSPNETFKAVIREEKDSKEVKKQYLEIWKNSAGLSGCIDLTALDIHGDVYADSEFGSLDWSPDETAVVYIAERKLKKSEPYIKRNKVEDASISGGGETLPKKGEEYVYRQDWGEQLVGKHLSVIVMCKIQTETFSVLEGIPESCCPGQVRFAPDGKSVVGVAWHTEPRRLGLIFCTNRPGFIFNLTLDGQLTKLSAEGVAVRSPRFRPNGDLLWLQRPADGPHHACHALVIKKKHSSEVTPVIDIVQTSVPTAEGEPFFGIYNTSLSRDCFSKDGSRAVFSTPGEFQIKTYTVNIENGKISELPPPSEGSLTVLDVKNDVILATWTNMTTPAQVFVCKLPAGGREAQARWSALAPAPAPLPAAAVRRTRHTHADCDDAVKNFTSLCLLPASDSKVPLVVWPHGGPHSGFVDAYSLEAALFASLGFALLRINFRGSTGNGDASVRCLLSNAGRYETQDCLLALSEVLEGDTKVCLYGASYGGFVTAHLAGHSPEKFCSLVLRNPLIDMATKGHYADNSDGCAVEAGFPFTEAGAASEAELLAMRRCSPLAVAHRVRAPTALMLGTADRRVPHYQGLEYARRLKANGVKTRIYMYDDNHSLSSLPNEMDSLINAAAWFLEHIQ